MRQEQKCRFSSRSAKKHLQNFSETMAATSKLCAKKSTGVPAHETASRERFRAVQYNRDYIASRFPAPQAEHGTQRKSAREAVLQFRLLFSELLSRM